MAVDAKVSAPARPGCPEWFVSHDVGPRNATRHVIMVDARENRDPVMAFWESLSQSCSHDYYVSAGWIDTWIECIKDHITPYLMILYEDKKSSFACMFTYTQQRRAKIFPLRSINVYASGNYDFDRITPIYNEFLTSADTDVDIIDLFRRFPFEWNEIVFPGLSPSGYPGSHIRERDQEWVMYDYNKSLYYIDISGPDFTRDSYLATLSSNTRSQIRRAYRLYAREGEVSIREAATVEEALSMARELYTLCDIRKNEKRLVCSINPFFVRFNDMLFKERFSRGEIQMLHVTSGDSTIGYLYNHVHHGTVYSYQGGFHYPEDNRYKPGLVAHVEAIVHNAGRGKTRYDFGAGDERYKKSLSNGSGTMLWARILKPSLKMRLYKSLKIRLEKTRSSRLASRGSSQAH